MDKLPTKILIFAGLVVIAVGVFTVARPVDRQNPPPTRSVFASDPTPNPSQVTTVLSPDGSTTLVMKEKKQESGVMYSFLTSSEKDASQKEVFTKTLTEGSVTIPFNTFSPDNKYFFLKESLPSGTRYFVIKLAGGEIFEASDLFAEKFSSDFVISNVTGWGGINLVVINTQKVGGGEGPSFWFEVPSKAFIRLSHSFN